MLMRTISLAMLFAVVSRLGAQAPTPVAECVNAAPQLPAAVATRFPAALGLLARLSWRTSHAQYTSIAARQGYAAVLDSLAARADTLFGAVRVSASTREAFRARARRARADVASWAVTHDAQAQAAWDIADLKPALLGELPLTVRVFTDSASGTRVVLNFNGDSVPGAIALCAASITASQYLEYLRADQVRQVAQMYAGLAQRWDLFIRDGYSMTLWERLGHSCRLGPLNYVVATFSAPGCGRRNRYALGPPAMQTLFVHPAGGLAPIFDSTGSFRSVVAIEWWGGLYHVYRPNRILTFGASVATALSDGGPMRIGGMLHTPIGAIGYFEARGGVAGHRGRVIVSADVMGWIPRARAALQLVSSARLGRVLEGMAKESVGR
jgi:hypothetical protein